MGRPEGFLFFDPHITSITTNYFDTNDFYFSGHIGSCVIFVTEWHALGKKWAFCVIIFIMINEWLMLTILRTHYLIDFATGAAMAVIILRLGERQDYYCDVLLMGLPTFKRSDHFYKPCVKCGWNNRRADSLTQP
jgi:hypothetical protein